jgi:hypothetical protein
MNDKLQEKGKLSIPFVGLCDGHVMSKVTQYAIEDAKICQGFSKVSLKFVQTSLQKLLFGPKNQGKGGRNGKMFYHYWLSRRVFKCLMKM